MIAMEILDAAKRAAKTGRVIELQKEQELGRCGSPGQFAQGGVNHRKCAFSQLRVSRIHCKKHGLRFVYKYAREIYILFHNIGDVIDDVGILDGLRFTADR